MKLLHGTWIPQEEGFVQTGDFFLWVETVETARKRKPKESISAI